MTGWRSHPETGIDRSINPGEISFGAFSRVDNDNYSELVFDKIGSLKAKKVTELYQKSGLCWYNTMYGQQK